MNQNVGAHVNAQFMPQGGEYRTTKDYANRAHAKRVNSRRTKREKELRRQSKVPVKPDRTPRGSGKNFDCQSGDEFEDSIQFEVAKTISLGAHECVCFSGDIFYDADQYDLNHQAGDDEEPVVDLEQSRLKLIGAVSDFVLELGSYARVSTSDQLIAEVEGMVALLLTVQGCTDYTSTTSALFLYVRKFFDRSVSSQIMEYVSTLFEPMEIQSGDEDGKVTDPEWLNLVRNVRTNWALCKGNRFFDHFSKLLGLMVTLGLCKASDVTFSIKEYKLFEPDVKMVHGSAIDIADAALGTVTFFVESMYASFKKGSLKPFLLGDQAAVEMDEEFANVVMWWDYVKTGNLMRVLGKSEEEFDSRLEELTSRLRNLMSGKPSFEKKLIEDKFMKLLRIKNDYITMKISSGVRKAPFTIELCGESSQGKTTCGDQLVDALLASANLPLGKEYRGTLNMGDDYMSGWLTHMLVMNIDDVSNEKSNFVQKPPTRAIIDICNNQPYYANMAELEKKGKVFVEPSIVVANTNVKNLDAAIYSNCPYSVQRRMHAVITVKAKEEFQFIIDGRPQGIDSSKIRAKFGTTKPLFDDIWVLTVEKAIQPERLSTVASYKVVEWNGKPLEKVSMRTVMQYLIEKFAEHRLDQEDILSRMKERSTDIALCNHGGCKQIRGYCDLHDHLPVCEVAAEEVTDDDEQSSADSDSEEQFADADTEIPVDSTKDECRIFDKQFGYDLTDTALWAGGIVGQRIKQDFAHHKSAFEGYSSLALIASARLFSWYWDWILVIPTPWLDYPIFQGVAMFLDRRRIMRSYIMRTILLWIVIVGLLVLSCLIEFYELRIFTQLFLVFLGIAFQKAMVRIVKYYYRKQLLKRNTLGPIMQEWRNTHVSTLCKAAGIVGALYAMSKLYKRWRDMQGQGSLEPTTEEEIKQRDSEVNPWTQVVTRSLPMSLKSKTISPERLIDLVKKNLVYGTVCVGKKTLRANGLFVKSNVVVVPDHYFECDNLAVTFRKENPDSAGGKFATRLCKDASYLIPNTDLRICYSPTGGSFKDITPWFPVGKLSMHQFTLLYRHKDGTMTHAQGVADIKKTTNGTCIFEGGTYKTLSIDTFKGLCGATLVSHGNGSCITGIHLGGYSGSPEGCFGTIQQEHLNAAYEHLKATEGVLLTSTAESFEKQVMGVNIVTGGELHPKSPINYMPHNSQVQYFGTCVGHVTSHSDVKVTKISEHVMDVLNSPNVWGPPKMKPEWFGWQKCLHNLSIPAVPYEHNLLTLCVRDYKEDLLPVFRSPLWNGAKPLTDHENLCGIPGKKFMDALKLDTSIGYPLTGTKRRFVTELEPTLDKPNNRELDPEIMNEINRCLECWKKGERAYTIAKACKKDEVLPTKKEKCRIFYGNPVALTWAIRKYFLPILRVLQMNPLKSECAVGINCHGPEWQQLYDYVLKHGKDNIIGGDYGQYDQRIPSQLIIAAMRILIDFARECDYTEEDLNTMEAIAGELAFPLIAFNGDLIGLIEGTHISGNSLTVIINGICGSLNLRACFYTHYPSETFENRKPFRKYVNAMTYGDDNIGSASSEVPLFTIKAISEFLGEYGQIYTMPDKESELLDYLPFEQFEFLKRKSVYHPALGVHTGALIEKSIHKMLHCYIRPKGSPLTEEMACAQNIDTALTEWFNHGEQVYEDRRLKMQEIAERAKITHLCTTLERTYGERVEDWNEKYSTTS
uniref:RNA-dependent RNA polymerase n=1 Tax=Perinereis wilsoni marma-like virus 7 TaxID=3237982 RepID=A0AB39A3B8_9VIRU